MDENEFECFGKYYKAELSSGGGCKGCHMLSAKLCSSAPACSPETRNDGRNVIFVEKQQ